MMRRTAILLAAATLALGSVATRPGVAESPRAHMSEMRPGAALDPLVARWASAWNAADPAAVADLFTPDATYEDLAFQVAFAGHEGIAQWLAITSQAIPDAHVDVEEAFRAGDRIAVRWTFTGTPEVIGKVEGSGVSFSVPVVTLMALEEGRIAGVTDAYNLADLLRQVGLPAESWTPPAR